MDSELREKLEPVKNTQYVYKLTHELQPDLYFGSLNKAHKHLLCSPHIYTNVTKSFSQFCRWIKSDGKYEVDMHGNYLFIIEVL